MKTSYIMLFIILIILMFIKIYVANKLYLVSRKIQKNSIQINALKEEKNILKLKIEKLKYKNTIIDPLFSYKVEEDKIMEKELKKQKEIPIQDKPVKNIQKQTKDTKELFQTLELEDGGN